MIPYFQRGFRFMAWADNEVIATLATCPESQSEALPMMAHILAAEHIWLYRVLQKTPQWPVWPQWDLEECQVVGARVAQRLHVADHARPVVVARQDGTDLVGDIAQGERTSPMKKARMLHGFSLGAD